ILFMSQSKINHDKWLRDHNCHPDQIKQRKKSPGKLKGFNVAKQYYGDQSNNFPTNVSVLPVRSIFEDIRNGNETPETLAAINEKKSRISSAFNKGPLQLISK